VFGDFHGPNIIVNPDGKSIVLVDFEWCGEDGVVRYPADISTTLMWHDDVYGCLPIGKQHDTFRLEYLIHGP
jgi:Ser/Thr protein kinase RdoA (MazF antagonist)